MIRKVPSDQVALVWDFIKPAVLNGALKDGDEAFATYMLQRFLSGSIDLWLIYDSDSVVGIINTTIIKSTFGAHKLIILSLYGKDITNDVYRQSIDELKTFAKSKGCLNIVVLTNSSRMINIAKELGADVSTVEVTFTL